MRARWLLLVLASAACEARTTDDRTVSAPIVKGTPDAADPAVVAIVKRRVHCHEAFVETFCSGVLVHDRVVLTAAHCATSEVPLDIEVYLGAKVNGGEGHFYAVADQRLHPDYDPSTYANDLALLQLATSTGVTPVSIDATEVPALGASVRTVGFGGTGAGSNGEKLEGLSKLAAIDPFILRTEPSPALACGGDSGAPLFFDDTGGPRLIGVIRSGDAACAEYTNATRIGPYVDAFVRPYLENLPNPRKRSTSLTESLCTESCATDDDCPRGMLCLPERELGNKCGYATLRSGSFGASCSNDNECASGMCAGSGPGDDGRTCGCFVACRDQKPPQASGGGGCATGSQQSSGAFTAVLAASLWLVRARRSRRRTSG